MSARGILKLSVSLLLLTLLAPGLRPGGAQEWVQQGLQVQEHTLENGLRLFVLPRPGAPTVSFVVQYGIGSVHERPGATGLAHFLEHLLFKGSTSVGTRDYESERPLLEEMDVLADSILLEEGRTRPDTARLGSLNRRIRVLEEAASDLVVSNEFDAILSANGARSLNATTTTESTTYFVELPANRAELWFILEADRMGNPVFREFYSERDVVAEERRLRLETNGGGLLYEAHMATAFQVHPYGSPVIGFMADIQRLSRREVASYFSRFYTPDNAVVTVVGDVDPDQILRWARGYLGQIPPGEPIPPVRIVEPRQSGERRVEVVFDAEPILRVGWHVPGGLHPDAPALAMLASVLTGGRSSRIYRRLVLEDRLASGVTSGTGPGQLFPDLFTLEAYPRAPHSVEEVEAAIYEEIEKLVREPPQDVELQRVRNQLEASEVRRLRSNFGLALQIAGSASLFGDWRTSFGFSERIQAVTPEDLQRVAASYFRKENRTVAVLVKPAPVGEGEW
jgi:predicted Zn-dependent peptidase